MFRTYAVAPAHPQIQPRCLPNIAETFCAQAARRVQRCLDQIEDNDDERMHRIARAAYVRRGYEHSINP